jgi:hypothetical protein
MSLTRFHHFWDTILSQNLQAVANQTCRLEGSSPYKGPLIGGYTVYSIHADRWEIFPSCKNAPKMILSCLVLSCLVCILLVHSIVELQVEKESSPDLNCADQGCHAGRLPGCRRQGAGGVSCGGSGGARRGLGCGRLAAGLCPPGQFDHLARSAKSLEALRQGLRNFGMQLVTANLIRKGCVM